MFSSALFLVSVIVWEVAEPLEKYTLAEGSMPLWRALRLYSHTPPPICTFCFLCVVKNVISQLPDIACHHAFLAIMDYPSEAIR